MKPITPEQRDGIPREVATAMLTEPRAKLSNRMRKNCIAARSKVFVSSSPIQRVPAQNEQTGEIVKGWSWTEKQAKQPEDKMKHRFASVSLRQLGNWLCRSISRRAIIQRRYLAVPNSDVQYQQARFDAIRAALAAIAGRLDIIRDACEDEIAMRQAKCDSIAAIRMGFSSTVKFYRKAGL